MILVLLVILHNILLQDCAFQLNFSLIFVLCYNKLLNKRFVYLLHLKWLFYLLNDVYV